VTVHDAKILARQETILGRHYADGGRLMPRALLKAKRILTISEFTRREIQRLVECPESVIKVVHLGVSSAYRPPADKGSAAADLSIRHQISGEFCLAFGASAPYKNTRTLVRVFSRLLASGATRTQLVVIGNDGGFSDELRHIAQQEGGAQGIRLLGYVPFEDSLMFLGCARFFVYPSLYEGFGFPPLEAMACGTPVLAADSSSIPEVAGPGAMLYEAQSPEGLSSGILKMDELCEDIARRECATHVGMCHAARFTWDRTAQETLETLLRALGTR
jgi:glycosyltransferase involved in cell wall biosynthesis